MRHIVDEDGAGSALGAVAAELSSGQTQLVAQRPGECLLLRNVDSPLPAVDVEGDEPLADACVGEGSGAEQIVGRGNRRAPSDNALDEAPSRNCLRRVVEYSEIFHQAIPRVVIGPQVRSILDLTTSIFKTRRAFASAQRISAATKSPERLRVAISTR